MKRLLFVNVINYLAFVSFPICYYEYVSLILTLKLVDVNKFFILLGHESNHPFNYQYIKYPQKIGTNQICHVSQKCFTKPIKLQ
jgi:hypothetical protein